MPSTAVMEEKQNERKGTKKNGEDSRDYDSETLKALEEMNACQNAIDALNEKASEEIVQIEQKYRMPRSLCYKKRNGFVKNINRFWFHAIVNHPQIADILDDDDVECLIYLTKLEVVEFEDIKSGYMINFHFGENPYFENDVLTKTFHWGSSGDPTVQSTEIRWKEGKNFFENIDNSNVCGQRKRLREHESLFRWFTDDTNPRANEIGDIFRDELWLNPLTYYLQCEEENEDSMEEEELEEEEEDFDSLLVEEIEEEAGEDDDGNDYDEVAEEKIEVVTVKENGKTSIVVKLIEKEEGTVENGETEPKD